MSKVHITVAGQKTSQTRTRNTQRTTQQPNDENITPPNDSGQPEDNNQQNESTAKSDKTKQPENINTPPLYTTPQLYIRHNGNREATYASPLASTLLARLNPNDPRTQPGEYWDYTDLRYIRNGYI